MMTMQKAARHAWIGLFLVSAWLPTDVESQSSAFCALRDPVRQIYSLYPEARTYRSIVRSVGARARDAILKQLSFKLHFDEIGKHTLYVAVAARRPLGLVHVRTEAGRWGLMEVVWSLNLDLTVRGFRFQRYRGRVSRKVIEGDLQKMLVGKGASELREMLERREAASAEGGERRELERALLRSALKTIVVTRTIWLADLEKLRALDAGLEHFPGGSDVTRISEPYTAEVREALRTQFLDTDSTLHHDSVKAFLVLDKKGDVLGCVVRGEWSYEEGRATISWAFELDGTLHSVESEGASPPELNAHLQAVAAPCTSNEQTCLSYMGLMAFEASTLCSAHTEARTVP